MRATNALLALVVALLSSLVGLRAAEAATTVTGAVNFDTTWTAAGSPYILTGTVSVASGVTLNIDPGVVVQARNGTSTSYELTVNGTLRANGTAANPVTFTVETGTSSGQWAGLRVTSSGTLNLQNSIIYSANNAIRLDNGLAPAQLTVSNLTVDRHAGYAINLGTPSTTGTFSVSGLRVTCPTTSVSGVVTSAGRLQVLNSWFKGCLYGVYSSNALLTVDRTVFWGGRYGVYGANVSYIGTQTTTITHATFYDVGTGSDSAVYAFRSSSSSYGHSISISDSIIGESDAVLRDGSSTSYPVSFNSFSGNVVWNTAFAQASQFSGWLRYNALLKDPANGDFTPTERSPARYYFPTNPAETVGAVPYAGDPTGAGLHGFWYTNQTFTPGTTVDASGDVVIVTGAKLTFQPNTRIRFATTDSMSGGLDVSKAELRVEGELELDGTNSSPVTVTSAAATPARGDWYGIVIPANAFSFNVGQVDIGYAKRGVSLYNNDHLVIGCTIHDASEYGVYIDGGTPNVEDTVLYGNQVGVFAQRDGGIGTPATVDMRNVTIRNSTQQGLYLSNANVNWTSGQVYDNGADGIYAFNNGFVGSLSLSLDNLTIAHNSGDGIDVFRSSSSSYVLLPAISDTVVSHNAGAGYRDTSSTSYPVSLSCGNSNLWGNGSAGSYSPTGTCFSYNPLYADITNRDYTPTKFSPLRKLGSSGSFIGYLNWDGVRVGPNMEGFLWEDFTFAAANGVYSVLGDIVVTSGVRLTFEAGAQIRVSTSDDMGGTWTLGGATTVGNSTKVEFHFAPGSLYTFPTTGSPAVLSPNSTTPVPGQWEGFRFYDATAKVQKVRLEYPSVAFRVFGPRSPVFEDTEGRYVGDYGVYATDVTSSSNLVDVLTSSFIGDGSFIGVYTYGASSRVRSSYITHGSYGVYAYVSSAGTSFTTSLVNNTIVHMSSVGILWGRGSSSSYSHTANAWNNVVAVTAVAVQDASSSSYDMTDTLRNNAFFNASTTSGAFSTNSGNTTADPRVEDDDWDDYPRWWDGGLWAESPAINAGTTSAPNMPTKDINGRARTIGSNPDIGAWEFDPSLNREPRADGAQILTSRIVPRGESFSLDGSAAFDPDGTIASAFWTVKDGTVLPGLNVTHTINTAGTSWAYLTIIDNNGAEDHALVNLNVNPRVIADAGPETYSDANGDPATFDGTQSCDPDEGTCPAVGGSTLFRNLTFRWNFGDGSAEVSGPGSNSLYSQPRHTYTTGGDYLVTLTVTDNEGLSASDTTIAHVLSPTDTTGPLIQHTEVTDGKPVATAVPVTATITDPSGVLSAVVWYRTTGSTGAPAFVAMTNTGSSYTANIPAAAVVAPGVDYWIQAADNSAAQNSSLLPANAPTTVYNFTVTGDLNAPVITHTPIANGQVAGTAVTVSATITDATGVASASLYFRPSNGTSFGAVSMSRVSGNLWSAQIPAFVVASPGVSYYISATDSSPNPQTGTSPSGAPTTLYTFTVGSGDTIAPTIAHTPIANNQTANTAVTVTAGVVDTGGVSTVRVLYRTTGTTGAFTSASLSLISGTTYQTLIPGSAIVAPGVDYYLEATDSSGNTGRDPAGAPASFYTFTVQAVDATGPAITHTPIANGQPENTSVTVSASVTDASGLSTVQLFYRPVGFPFYSSVTMNLVTGTTYSAAIPSFSVTSAGVQYYIRATDTRSNVSALPSTAPGTPYSFTVGTADTTPPSITHTPIANGQVANTAVTVAATVTDTTGVASVTLWYRALGASSFTSLPMTLSSGSYSANIPAAAVTTAGVEYYITAVDTSAAANTVTVPGGAPLVTYTFSVISPDVTPPSITHTAATTLTYGNNLTLTATVTDASGVGSVTLYWAIDSGAFQATTMAAGSGGSYSASITAGSVPFGTAVVRYYIAATDTAGNSATSPSTGSSAPYTVMVSYPDTTAPSITHTALTTITYGTSTTFNATVTDAGTVSSVTLNYAIGSGSFSAISFVRGTGNAWSVTLAAGLIPNGTTTVRYYITATDAAGNSANAPSAGASSPYAVSVVYPDTTAPTITHTPVSSIVYGNPLSISATVTDASGVGPVTLYFAFGSGSFGSVAMTAGSANSYSATIAAGSIPNGTTSIRYYLSATDAASPSNTGTSPVGGAGSPYSVTVTYPDTTGPSITHTALSAITYGSATTFTATVTDATGVGSVTLYWRLGTSGSFSTLSMAGSGSSYSATLPAASVPESASTLQYYLSATDTAPTPNTSTLPVSGASAPFSVAVEFPAGHNPTLTHTALTSYTYGTPFTVSASASDPSGIGSVTLYWALGTGAFTAVAMTGSGGNYSATVPASSIPNGTATLRYYITATDTLDYSSSSPAAGAGAPHTLPVTYPDTTPPLVDVSPIAGPIAPGVDLLVTAVASDAGSGVASVRFYYRASGDSTFSVVNATSSAPYDALIPGAAIREPSIELYALAVDGVGNIGTSATATVLVVPPADDTAPLIGLASIVDGQPSGTPVTVSATITDASGVASATLYYRADSAGAFTSTPMVPGGGDNFTAVIPGDSVRTPAVEYYVVAFDNAELANSATAPSGAPGTPARFSVTPGDTAGPTLGHTPVAGPLPEGVALDIEVTATDTTSVGEVRLFWRTGSDAPYTQVVMTAIGGGRYLTSIGPVRATSVSYYATARDGLGNASVLPAAGAGSPFEIAVFVPDRVGPTIAHTELADGQAPGQAVVVEATISDASGVATATLNYRASGATVYNAVPMTLAGGTWSAIIPASAVVPPGIEYYIEAVDAAPAGNVSLAPVTGRYAFTVDSPLGDTTPPTISHTPVSGPQLVGATVGVAAAVADASGVGRVTLYVRSAGDSGWVSLPMALSAGVYRVDLPRFATSTAGVVEYYIEASDAAPAGNLATEPAGAPAAYLSFTVVAPDLTGPVVALDPTPTEVEEGTPITVSATVTDPSGVGEVFVFFRTAGDASWASARMTLAAGLHTAIIPGGSVEAPALELFVEASDRAGNVTDEPAGGIDDPIRVTVTAITPVDVTPPTILHSPPANAAYGRPLSITAVITDASGVAGAVLWYRNSAASGWASANMTGDASNRWRAAVPAASLTTEVIAYYIEALDASAEGNRATDPDGAPDTTYEVTVVGLPVDSDDVGTDTDAGEDTSVADTDETDTADDTSAADTDEADTSDDTTVADTDETDTNVDDTTDDTTVADTDETDTTEADSSGDTAVDDAGGDTTLADTGTGGEDTTSDGSVIETDSGDERPVSRGDGGGCSAGGTSPRGLGSVLFGLGGLLLVVIRGVRGARERRAQREFMKRRAESRHQDAA
jgi:hypothetical protein